VITVLCCLRFVPETRDRSLEEIEQIWEDRVSSR